MSNNLWVSCFNGRHHWAERARRAFAEAMPSAYREEILTLGKESTVPIAVYGPSQVGKTTLILDLMGIREDAQESVGKVLRGGTKTGQASTATLMIYRRSKDDHYRLARPGAGKAEVFDEDGLEAELARVRATVESGPAEIPPLWLEEPFKIDIPRRHFAEVPGPDFHILDLPGHGSSTVKEHAHVEALIGKYTALATSILLVTRAIDLRQFDNPGLKPLNHWHQQSRCFRLVLTHAFSPESMVKDLRKLSTTADCPDRLREEIHKIYKEQFSKDLNCDPNLRIYPLEFGRSWKEASAKDPSFQVRFGPVMDHQRRVLREDLIRMASPHHRIFNILEGKAIIQGRMKKAEANLAALKMEVEGLGEKLNKAKQAAKKWKRRCKEIEDNLSDETKPEVKIPWPRKRTLPEYNVPEMKAALRETLSKISQSAGEYVSPLIPELGGDACREASREVESLLNAEARPLRNKLNSYKIDKYRSWPWHSDDLEEDLEFLEWIRTHAPGRIESYLSSWALTQRKARNKPLKIELVRYQRSLETSEVFLQEAENSFKKAQRSHQEAKEDWPRQAQEDRKALRRLAVFPEELEREALAEHNRLVDAINMKEACPSLRFFRLLEIHQLFQEQRLFQSAHETSR